MSLKRKFQKLYKDIAMPWSRLSEVITESPWRNGMIKIKPLTDGRASYVCVDPSGVDLELQMPEPSWPSAPEISRAWSIKIKKALRNFEVTFTPRVRSLCILVHFELSVLIASLLIYRIIQSCHNVLPKLRSVAVQVACSHANFIRICRILGKDAHSWDTIVDTCCTPEIEETKHPTKYDTIYTRCCQAGSIASEREAWQITSPLCSEAGVISYTHPKRLDVKNSYAGTVLGTFSS